MDTLFQIAIPLATPQFFQPVTDMLSGMSKEFLVVYSASDRTINIKFWARDVYDIHNKLKEISPNLHVYPSDFEPVFDWGFPTTHAGIERAFQYFTAPCSTLILLAIAYELMIPPWLNQGTLAINMYDDTESFAQSYPFVVNKFFNFIRLLIRSNECYSNSQYFRTVEFIRRYMRMLRLPEHIVSYEPLGNLLRVIEPGMMINNIEFLPAYPRWMLQLNRSMLYVLINMVSNTSTIRFLPRVPEPTTDFGYADWRNTGIKYATGVVREIAYLYAASQTGLDYVHSWQLGFIEYDHVENIERTTVYDERLQRLPYLHVDDFLRRWWIAVTDTFSTATPEMMN